MVDETWTHKPMAAPLEMFARASADVMARALKDIIAKARETGADSNEAISIGAACMATQLEVLVLQGVERGHQLVPGMPKEHDEAINKGVAQIALADIYTRFLALAP